MNVLLVRDFCPPDIDVLFDSWLLIHSCLIVLCVSYPNDVWCSKGSMQTHTHIRTWTWWINELLETDNTDPHILCLASQWRPGSDIPKSSYWNAAEVRCSYHCASFCASTELHILCLASQWRPGSDIPRLSYWNAAEVHCSYHCASFCTSTELHILNANPTPEVAHFDQYLYSPS
jgi:hypothetical protein